MYTAALSISLVFSIAVVALSNSLPLAHADTFGSPIVLDNSLGDQSNPHVSASSANNVYVAWTSELNGNSNIRFERSTDGGASFGNPITLPVDGSFSFLSAIAASGNNVYVVFTHVTSTSDTFLVKSTDSGTTFSSPIKINTGTNARSPAIAVSGNNVYVTWEDFGLSASNLDPEIFFAASANGGASFSTPVDVSNTPGTSSANPSIAASGNNVYTTWSDCNTDGTNCRILFNKSTDGGATFLTSPVALNNPGICCSLPDVAASGNNVYVVWNEATVAADGQESIQIFLRISTDGGNTFGNSVNLSNDPGLSNRPRIDVSGNNVAVQWENKDPLAAVPHWELLFRSSTNGGATFGSQVSTNIDSSDSTLNDVALSGTNVYSTWNVFENNKFDIYFMAGTITQLDTTPPDTAITSPAIDGNGAAVQNGGTTVSTSIRIAFTGTDNVAVAGFQCSIDGGTPSTCTSPFILNNLATGTHTFYVRAIDTSNNVDPTPASFSWTILTPAQGIQALINYMNSQNLPTDVKNGITGPLHQAITLLTDNNPSNDHTACNKLDAFIGEVNYYLTHGQISQSLAAQLIQQAQPIKTALRC